jgi:hypothetical protein
LFFSAQKKLTKQHTIKKSFDNLLKFKITNSVEKVNEQRENEIALSILELTSQDECSLTDDSNSEFQINKTKTPTKEEEP